MISTVLYEKKGVITEERFKKMTPIQWIFHYKEIQRQKQQEMDEKSTIIHLLTKSMTMSGILSHPDIDLKKAIANIQSDGKNAEESAAEAISYINEHKDVFPDTITVNVEPKQKESVIQGRIDKELGIVIQE